MPLYLLKINIFGVPFNILEVLGLIAIISALFEKKVFELTKFFRLPKLFVISCALVVLGTLISIFANGNRLTELGILKSWFLFPIIFSFFLYHTLSTRESVENILKTIYFSTFFVALIGVIYKLLSIVTFDNRLSAFYQSPNQLAMFVAPGIIFGFYFLIFEQNNLKRKLLHIALLSILFVCLYYSFSYAAWFSVFAGITVMLFVSSSSKKNFFKYSFVVFCLFVFSIFLQTKTEKFSTLVNDSSRSSLASRQTIWKVSTLLIKENPIVGIGPGNFQQEYLEMQPLFEPYLEWAVPQPHNVFFAFWLQTGIVGFAGFLLLLSFVFHSLFKSIKKQKNTALAASLLGFFFYTLVHGIVDTTYWKNDLSLLFWICIFLVLFLHVDSKE